MIPELKHVLVYPNSRTLCDVLVEGLLKGDTIKLPLMSEGQAQCPKCTEESSKLLGNCDLYGTLKLALQKDQGLAGTVYQLYECGKNK